MLANNITDLIGNTPLVRISNISDELGVNIYLKMESLNPMSSVKDRLGLALIQDAEKKGLIKPDTLIVEPTSGNTGIGLAFVCAQRGYKLALTMPESMSMERRRILKALGATLHLTPASEGMVGAIDKAKALVEETENSLTINQFANEANPDWHEETTGPEIYNDLNGNLAAFVAGVGTGGTFTGVARFMKKKNPKIQTVAVEPEGSAVLSGNPPGSHKIQGIGAGFIPDVMDISVMDRVITVNGEEAGAMSRRLAREEGIFLGISGGGNVLAAMELAKDIEFMGKTIVTVACDSGERYLSTWLYQEEEN